MFILYFYLHLRRFMQEIMINISRGLRTRIGLDQMTEKKHIALFNKQKKIIERLDVECKEVHLLFTFFLGFNCTFSTT